MPRLVRLDEMVYDMNHLSDEAGSYRSNNCRDHLRPDSAAPRHPQCDSDTAHGRQHPQ